MDGTAPAPPDGGIEMTSINFIFLFVLPVICFFGLIGNLLVCVAIVRFPNLRTVTNFLLVSLAVADSAVCLIVMPLAAVQEINGGKWLLGKAICDIWVGLDVLMCTASIWNLCAVSIDRYLAVSRPIWYAMKRKPSFAALLIFIAWALSIFVCIPALLFVGGFGGNDDELVCILNVQPLFQIISSIVSFYVPCIFIVLLYVKIARAARKLTSSVKPNRDAQGNQAKRRFRDEKSIDLVSESVDMTTVRSTAQSKPTVIPLGFQNPLCAVTEAEELRLKMESVGSKPTTPNSIAFQSSSNLPSVSGRSLVGNLATEARASPSYQTIDLNSNNRTTFATTNGTTLAPRTNKRVKMSVTRERRATMVIGIVVGVFISCWLPFFVVNVVLGACPTCSVSYAAFQFVTWLGWCNSVLNPIIYTIFNRELRAAFFKILLCKR